MSEALEDSVLVSTTENRFVAEMIDLSQDNSDTIVEFIRPRHHETRDRKRPEFYIPESEARSKSITPNKKKKRPNKQHVGSRIAKYFGHEIYLGTVTSAGDYYRVIYDDNDEEDFNERELIEGLELYGIKGCKLESKQKGKQKRRTFDLRQGENHARIKRVNKTKQTKSSSCPSKAIAKSKVQQAQSSAQSAIAAGPTLFEIHNISEANIATVRSILPNRHHQSAELVTEFFLFCYERQLVWQRKRSGTTEELTKDVKMAKNFYCNVYRELDRGTAYFRYNLVHHRVRPDSAFGEADWYKLEEVLWDSLCYRLLNKIETFERFGKIPNQGEWEEFVDGTLEPMWRNQEIVFTGAHQNMGKDRYLATINSLWQKDGAFVKKLASSISSARDLESCYGVLLRVNNVGKFFAWQVLCDLLESGVVPFSEDDWVKLGPGAANGLKVILGDKFLDNNSHVEKCMLLMEMQDQIYDALGLMFPKFMGRDITLKNIEHCLCEFPKYKNHGGRKFEVGGRGSRSHLDLARGCHFCNAFYDRSHSKLCDLCRTVYCESCCNDIAEVGGAWVCSECTVIESRSKTNL